MDHEVLKERSAREFEKFKIFISIVVILTGGLAGLIIKKPGSLEKWMIVLGSAVDILFALAAFKAFLNSEKYLKLFERISRND